MTESEARRVLGEAKKKHITKRGEKQKPNHKIPRRIYYCRDCGAWHCTKVGNDRYYD